MIGAQTRCSNVTHLEHIAIHRIMKIRYHLERIGKTMNLLYYWTLQNGVGLDTIPFPQDNYLNQIVHIKFGCISSEVLASCCVGAGHGHESNNTGCALNRLIGLWPKQIGNDSAKRRVRLVTVVRLVCRMVARLVAKPTMQGELAWLVLVANCLLVGCPHCSGRCFAGSRQSSLTKHKEGRPARHLYAPTRPRPRCAKTITEIGG